MIMPDVNGLTIVEMVLPKVELVAFTPNPVETIGRAAGICWDKEEKEDYASFVRRVIKIGHLSVVEHVCFTFRVEGISRALTHQWVRHRICSFSQRSQRYVKERVARYVMPDMGYLSFENRHSAEILITETVEAIWAAYRKLLDLGVKGEDARYVLPNACETKMVWTANVRELRHFFELRLDLHAQWEIRRMACMMFDEVMDVAPALFEDLKGLREAAGY